jgi:hypothetical protein
MNRPVGAWIDRRAAWQVATKRICGCGEGNGAFVKDILSLPRGFRIDV